MWWARRMERLGLGEVIGCVVLLVAGSLVFWVGN
jgi:hypothetical protein